MRGIVLMIVWLAGWLTVGPARAQSWSDRVARIRDGTVRLSFGTRDLVCGDGHFIGFDLPDAFYQYSQSRDGYSVNVTQDVKPECRGGPLRLVVVKSAGRVTELRAAVGVAWRASPDAVDLGLVSGAEAADWLVDLAQTGDDAVGRMALLAAAAADSARITGRVLELAQNRRVAAAVRERAIRWSAVVGGAEGRGDEVDRVLRALAADAAESAVVRDRAVRDLRPTAANRAHLRSLYRQVAEQSLRERIIREIGSAGGEDEVAWVREVALDAGEPVALRDRALRVLAEELDRPDEVRALYPRLDRIELRERVVRLVAEQGDADAAAWLAAIVLDEREQPPLRDRAVRGLAERGAPSDELAALYDRLTSTTVKQRLIRLLAERGDRAASDKLAAIAGSDPSQELRREAARRLGEKK